ncbi:lipoprotein [Alicyclobacillus acidoterrestris]|nr:lipoprotein [Alicyclobacillus acidoterrestris]
MKRTMLIGAIFAASGVAISGCATGGTNSSANNTAASSTSQTGADSTKALPVIRVAYMPDIHGAAPIVIAQQEGFFKKEGIDVQAVKFTSGPPEIDAMAAGQIDMAYIGPGAIFLAAEGKADIVAVDSLNLGDMILASPKSGITSIAGLKGHTIGVPEGTSGQMILNLALKKAGLKTSDVKIVNMDVSSEVSAFVAGHVDAVATWNPYSSEIQQQVAGAKVLATDKTFMPDFTFPQVWTASPAFEKSHSALVQKFVDALAEANDWRMNHVQQAVAMTASYTGAPADSLTSQAGTTQWLSSSQIKTDMANGTVDKWIDNLEEQFVQSGTLPSVVQPSTFVKDTYYQNVP